MVELDDELGDLATSDEIRAAIDALSKEEAARLKGIATLCLMGTEFQESQELINEAVLRTMKAANGEKGRRWKRSVPFIAFMIMTVRGIADDSLNSASQMRVDRIEAMVAPDASSDDLLGVLGYSNPCVVEQAIELEETEERQAQAKRDSDDIDAFFADDDEVNWVIMGIKDKCSVAEVCQLSEMTTTQYETARRRFRRGLQKIFPGRRNT